MCRLLVGTFVFNLHGNRQESRPCGRLSCFWGVSMRPMLNWKGIHGGLFRGTTFKGGLFYKGNLLNCANWAVFLTFAAVDTDVFFNMILSIDLSDGFDRTVCRAGAA